MSAFVLPYHEISPIALDLGILQIRWYGLAYAAGLLLGLLYIRRLLSNDGLWAKKAPLAKDKADDLLIWIALGVIIGGRLGFILFYEPSSYLANPLKIFAVWEGGMAFHGGLLGTILAIYMFSKRNNVSIFSVGDLVAAAVPIGIFFGRIANFINGNLYGRVSDVPWAMIFPEAEKRFPDTAGLGRHPSQLYEAALEGLIIFFILRYMIYNRNALHYPGLIAGTFLILYAVGRSIAENFRAQDVEHAFSWGPFTAGIVYSIPMAVFGAYLIRKALQTQKLQTS